MSNQKQLLFDGRLYVQELCGEYHFDFRNDDNFAGYSSNEPVFCFASMEEVRNSGWFEYLTDEDWYDDHDEYDYETFMDVFYKDSLQDFAEILPYDWKIVNPITIVL